MAQSAQAYARQLKRLLPPGRLWDLLPDSILSLTLLGIGDELNRVEARGEDLIEETDPRTADETLSEWETMLGLPDEDVTAIPGTTAERRVAITAKFTRYGGQTPAYFVGLALACGWVVYVVEGYAATVFRVGIHTCIDPLRGEGWAHVWKVQVDYALPVALTSTELEAILRRAAPAHTVIEFEYL